MSIFGNIILIYSALMLIFFTYMLIRQFFVDRFRARVFHKNHWLWLALDDYHLMLYRFWDWRFHKMVRPDFYKTSGLLKSEILKDLEEVKIGK